MTATATPTRPASEFEPLELLHGVREIAEASGVEGSEHISTRAWDIARPLSERFADTPAARRICEHLGLGWEKVLELAFLPEVAQLIALVARRLGAKTLTPGEYRTEVRRMLAADGRSAHGGQLRLPTDEQIAALAGSWDRALANASLGARSARGRQRQRALTIIEALDRCYEHYETEPTSAELHIFAKANGIPLTGARGRPWASHVAEWKERRRAAGLPVPDRPPPRHRRWDYAQNIGAGRPGERRRGTWTREELIEWLIGYLAQLAPRERSRERGYNDWAANIPGAPRSSGFDAYGGWSVLRAEAQAKLRQQRRVGAGCEETTLSYLS